MRERQPDERQRGREGEMERRRRRETKACCNDNCHKQKQPQNLLATSYPHICTHKHTHTHTHTHSNMQCIISVLSYATPMRPLRLIKFKSECFLVTQIAKQTNSPKRHKKMPDFLPPPPARRPLLPSCLPWQIVETTQCPPVRFAHTPSQRFIAKRWPAPRAAPAIVSIELSPSGVFSYSQPTLPPPLPLVTSALPAPSPQHCTASWRRKTANILTHTGTHGEFV